MHYLTDFCKSELDYPARLKKVDGTGPSRTCDRAAFHSSRPALPISLSLSPSLSSLPAPNLHPTCRPLVIAPSSHPTLPLPPSRPCLSSSPAVQPTADIFSRGHPHSLPLVAGSPSSRLCPPFAGARLAIRQPTSIDLFRNIDTAPINTARGSLDVRRRHHWPSRAGVALCALRAWVSSEVSRLDCRVLSRRASSFGHHRHPYPFPAARIAIPTASSIHRRTRLALSRLCFRRCSVS